MLIKRILTAVVLGGLFVPALFLLPAPAWTGLSIVIIAACAFEWAALSGIGMAMTGLFVASISAAILLLVAFAAPHAPWFWASAGLWIICVPMMLGKAQVPAAPWFKLAVGALVLIAAGLALIDIRGISPALLLMVMAIAWVSDTAAYFMGRAYGRHKLAPRVSPGKTWEGVFGGMVAVLLYAIMCTAAYQGIVIPAWLNHNAGLMILAAFWVLLAAEGIVGDLMESLLKRMAGVKDSGKLLPGHGGILDRVDALLPILPLAAIFYLP